MKINNWWWTSRFDEECKSKNIRPTLSATFSSAGFADLKTLKKVCKKAYTTDIKTTIHPDTDKEISSQYEKNIWTYRSIDGSNDDDKKYKEDDGSEKNKLGRDKKSLFVSTTHANNEKFWKRQAKAFFKEEKKDELGNKALEKISGFGKIYTELPEGKTQIQALKGECEKDCKGENTTSNQNIGKDALKFCSLQGYKSILSGAIN